MGRPIDWPELSKSKKSVRTSDNEPCGEVISAPAEEVYIVDGTVNIKKYKIPKSKIKFYNGSELVLQIPTYLMKLYEYQ
ncbi:MAG TPA: hypothetical protein VFV86_09285 [Nitrososphaeraceae archaeon]|nr:hypothetical protein [Nitrososphaeraceae archaeon]